MLEERVYISQFSVLSDGNINIKKTTEILKDGNIIATTHWRGCLTPNDPQAEAVLNDAYYYSIALATWSSLPQGSSEPAV